MNQNGGIHKGGFAVLCHRNGGSESPGILMQRRKNTKPQKDLDPIQRRANMRGAFITKSDLQGENILLIDDIYTTGTTIDEAAGALKKAGAGGVYFLVIAIGADG